MVFQLLWTGLAIIPLIRQRNAELKGEAQTDRYQLKVRGLLFFAMCCSVFSLIFGGFLGTLLQGWIGMGTVFGGATIWACAVAEVPNLVFYSVAFWAKHNVRVRLAMLICAFLWNAICWAIALIGIALLPLVMAVWAGTAIYFSGFWGLV